MTVATSMASAPGDSSSVSMASSSPSVRSSAAATSLRQHVLEYVRETVDGRHCSLCKANWGTATSVSNIAEHFKKFHRQVYEQRPGAEHARQPSIHAAFNNQDALAAFDDVVNLFIHHPALPLSLPTSKYFRKVLKSSSRVTYASVRQAIIAKDEQYLRHMKSLLSGRKVGIQIDGGKDIGHGKIIGVCIIVDRCCFCWDIIPCDDATVLNEAYYKDLLQRIVSELEALGAVVVSVTLDNEASPSAGVRLLQSIKPYLIHNRCYAHTAELMINDLQAVSTRDGQQTPAIPVLQVVVQKVHTLVSSIINNKYLRAALDAAQRDRGLRALKVVRPANTRKWSSAFLMLARFVKLHEHIARMETFIAAGAVPEQGERDARAAWLILKRDSMPARTECEAVRELLYWVYVGEQTVQRDGSSVIHGAFMFEDICCGISSRAADNHRVPLLVRHGMDHARVQDILDRRRELLQTSGIYWLSLALWPLPPSVALDKHDEANTEIEAYVTKCWSHWQANRVVMGLPPRWHCDLSNAQETAAKLEQFINAAQEELTQHLAMPSVSVSRAKTSFQVRSESIAARLIEDDRIVKRGRVVTDSEDDSDSVHVHGYWAAVTGSLPALSVIARSLLACCATEAAVERLFSKEGFIHNSYRNRLAHDIRLSLVRACINTHALDDEPIVGLYSDESSDEDD
jgi:hypothetical protein